MSSSRSRARGIGQGLRSNSHSVTNGGRISASLFRIPKDQEALLARDDAWAGGLSKQRGPPPNVPPSVLKGLEEFHTRKSKMQRPSPAQMTFPRPQEATFNLAPRLTSRSDDEESRPGTPTARVHGLPQNVDQSPGTEISWSQSPVRDRPAAIVHADNASGASSPIQPSPNPPTRPSADPNPPHNFATQIQSSLVQFGTATRPTLRSRVTSNTSSPTRHATKRKFHPPIPSSSIGNSEDELPLVPPRAMDLVERVTINRLAQPCPTPPSAQVIPCSESQSKQSDEYTPRKKRQRMQALNSTIFDEPDDRVPPSVAQEPEEQAPPPATQESDDHISPSVAQKSEDQAPLSATPESDGQIPLLVAQEPPVPQKTLVSPDEEPHHKPQSVTNVPKVTSPRTSRNPFEQFKAAYPDYTGSFTAFLRACRYLKYLEDQDQLIPFLYDDFIRAFTCGFLCYYVKSCKEDIDSLSAIKWYNRNTTRPVYSQHIMDKAAIARVYNMYLREIKRIDKHADIDDVAESDTQPDPIGENSQHLVQTAAKELAKGGEKELLENRSSQRRSCSPDLSTPKPACSRPQRGRSRAGPRLNAPDASSQPSVIIPNTSRSMLDANPTRIPETVQKPKLPRSARPPQETSMRPPSRMAAGSRVEKNNQSVKKKQGVKDKDNKSLLDHFQEAMRSIPHPRLTPSGKR